MSTGVILTIEEAKEQMKDGDLNMPFTIELSTPIVLTESKTVETLTFKNPMTAGDVESLPVANQVFGDFYRPISRICGEPISTIRKLPVAPDLQFCMELVSTFLTGSDKGLA